jgi:hypothetical protein
MVSNPKFKSILNFQKHYFEIMFPLFENTVLLSAGFSHSSPISRRDCPVIQFSPTRSTLFSTPSAAAVATGLASECWSVEDAAVPTHILLQEQRASHPQGLGGLPENTPQPAACFGDHPR